MTCPTHILVVLRDIQDCCSAWSEILTSSRLKLHALGGEYAAMNPLPRLSEESEESFDSSRHSGSHSNSGSATNGTNGASVNFSRPRPTRIQSGQSHSTANRSNGDRSSRGSTHAISAFHNDNANRGYPEEPRFSIDSDRTATTQGSSTSSGSSEVAWDDEIKQLRTVRRDKYAQQRCDPVQLPRPQQPLNGSAREDQNSMSPLRPQRTNTSTTSSSTSNSRSANGSMRSIPSGIPPGITKRISVDQQSERVSMSTDGHEDTASHHTVSDDGDSGSFDMDGRWQSSNYDTSGLSDAQIKKLLKKGINPSLYAEMKAAKKGKKTVIGPLLGNSFLG
ncbi:uncharacterized protein LTR77_004509 [Saxophila tyrrhenica]|uniref:Uncharacterized protein n=1 Tax=Saxophila tyrrhenica TaxID=1690608 RepID=A0AAV9PHA2_9PEZI|nr:hypothetical protein LTR77_004509 [Saxophila tyrrhenica]